MADKRKVPADYFVGLKENWQSDSLAGFLVFLVAMPLSLGIARASEFPPIMGLLTAIIGGMVVSFLAGSQLTIKGPAAGLIVIVAGAVHSFGGGEKGWHMALGAIVAAGLVQILFGVFRLGSFSEFFPTSVIHGMLAAIGLIIFSKQVYTLLGVDPKTISEMGPLALFAHLPKGIMQAQPKVAFIGILCLSVVFGLPLVNNRFIKRVPSPVIVLMLAIPLAFILDFKGSLPAYTMVTVGDFIQGLKVNVDFSGINQLGVFAKYVILFSLIGSIESLLTVKAMDGLDPYKRKSDYNKDVIAIGVGNVVAGVLGGLPMISEVARSSANVNNGAKTRWANFFHGFFLLIAVIFIPFLMEMIPNAALAALLIGVGYRLASPKEFISTYRIGFEQLVIFITTIIFTLAEDLLIGVFAGILMKLLIQLVHGGDFRSMFRIKAYVEEKVNNHWEVKVLSPATFSNLISFKKQFEAVPSNAYVTVDFSKSCLVDHTFMEAMHHYEDEIHAKGGHLTLLGFEKHDYSSLHPLSFRKFIKNPVFNTTLELSRRQKELAEYAAVHGLEFEPKISSTVIKLSLKPFPLIAKTKEVENLLVGSTPSFNFFYADVYMEESAFLTNMGRSLTILYVSNIKKELPDFTLENEGLLDILGFSAKRDIDFKNYPVFSHKYFLSGEDEGRIRQLFTEDLIRFFESNNIYIECVNNSLLIHPNFRIIEVKELDGYRALAKQLIALLLK